ncbi:MAG: glycine cleavage system aminomethyltransferase GcvT [Gammaproteobacteria bacterium]
MTGVQKTSLYDVHVERGARMVEFGGWSMPINYGSQIDEHHAVRNGVGLFDVSHMTIVDISGDDAEAYLRRLLANDVRKLRDGNAGQYRALYSCMLREDSGVLDDLIAYRLGEKDFRLVVNAATRDKDLEWLRARVEGDAVDLAERQDLAMIAVQGPRARDLVASLSQSAASLQELRAFRAIDDGESFVACTGYTGEDGFEILLPADDAPSFWGALESGGASPCGLGARDTLRLEAGLNLYGLDMDETVSPLECGLEWTVDLKSERDFIGRGALEQRLDAGVAMRQAGLLLEGKGVLRAGYAIQTDRGEGTITSGTFSPTLNRSIALARLPADVAGECNVLIRGRSQPARIVNPPFVRNGAIKIDL